MWEKCVQNVSLVLLGGIIGWSGATFISHSQHVEDTPVTTIHSEESIKATDSNSSREIYFTKTSGIYHKVTVSKKVSDGELQAFLESLQVGEQYDLYVAEIPSFNRMAYAIRVSDGEVIDLSGTNFIRLIQEMKKGDRYELLIEGSESDKPYDEMDKVIKYLDFSDPHRYKMVYFLEGHIEDVSEAQRISREKLQKEFPQLGYINNLKWGYWGAK